MAGPLTQVIYDADLSWEDYLAQAEAILFPEPDPEPDEAEEKVRLATVLTWTDEDAAAHWAEVRASHMAEQEAIRERAARYGATLEQLQAWNPKDARAKELRQALIVDLQDSYGDTQLCRGCPGCAESPERLDVSVYRERQVRAAESKLQILETR